jgi:membrane protease YdiL (CAAX protease family)
VNTRLSYAICEVALVAALVHFTYKAAKLWEPAGSNFVPGVLLILGALAAARLRPRCVDLAVRPLPKMRAAAVFFVAVAVVTAIGIGRGCSSEHVTRILVERTLCAGFAEELFFRGYVHSRVDRATERRVRVLGTPIGPGLLVGAVLFALVHMANPTLWFHGRFEFDWRWGVSAFVSSLLFGWLRERSGTIWLPAAVHAWLDILKQLVLIPPR